MENQTQYKSPCPFCSSFIDTDSFVIEPKGVRRCCLSCFKIKLEQLIKESIKNEV